MQAADEPGDIAEVDGYSGKFTACSWQRRAVERIVDLRTTVSLLEQALGKKFVNALRAWRYKVEGRDTAGTKTELVEALLVQHGADLLRNCKELREFIGKTTGAGAPGAFHSGKTAAIQFVAKADLPKELAGSPAPPRPPAAIVVRGPQHLRPLEDYQKQAKAWIAEALLNRSAVICSLPTGGGKTRVAIEAIVDLLILESNEQTRPRVMWVAHTRELCDQAAEAFRVVWEVSAPGKNLLMGMTAEIDDEKLEAPFVEAMQDPWDAAVIVTTPIVGARLLNRESWLSKLLDETAPRGVRALVIDEAHRAAARTYRELIASARRGSPEGGMPVIGLTATPFRTVPVGQPADAAIKALHEVFANGLILPPLLGIDPKKELIERGCLARPTYKPIRGTDLSEVSGDQADEWVDNKLSRLAGKSLIRRRRVFDELHSLLQTTPRARVLYFGPTVEDAEVMSFLLLQQGYASAVLSAKTHAPVRREMVRQFKLGSYQVLCNHGVLTTGFDDPQITHVVVARPTLSLVLYEQMVGRGLRGPLSGGTAECHILSVEDTFEGGVANQVWTEFIKSWMPYVAVLPMSGMAARRRRAGERDRN